MNKSLLLTRTVTGCSLTLFIDPIVDMAVHTRKQLTRRTVQVQVTAIAWRVLIITSPRGARHSTLGVWKYNHEKPCQWWNQWSGNLKSTEIYIKFLTIITISWLGSEVKTMKSRLKSSILQLSATSPTTQTLGQFLEKNPFI